MKACVHKTLTSIAIKRCGDKLSKSINRFANEILRGVEDEDATPLNERILNWHFYRSKSNKRIKKNYYMVFKSTSEDILAKRIKNMKKYKKDDKDRYNNLGRIIHHIQDMSTPAHVISIYHGPALSLKDKLNIKDYFEEFMVKQTNTDALGEGVVTGNNQKDFIALYEDAAEATLEYIKTAQDTCDALFYATTLDDSLKDS